MTNITNNYLDTTPLPPNNFVAQDPQSAELAGYIRSKSRLADMREAIARSIELNSTRSKSAEKLAQETLQVTETATSNMANQVELIQSEKDAIIANTTVDSEVILARGGKTTLGQRLDETDAQLELTETELTNNIRPNQKEKKCIVTFITDDGHVKDLTMLAPLFLEKGVPLTYSIAPMIKGNIAVSYQQDLLNLQNNHGHEVVSHTYNHLNLSTLSESAIESELVQAKNWLEERGFKGSDILVYPQGGNNPLVRKIARKHHKIAIGTLPNNGINEYPLRQFDVARVGMGSYFNTDGGATDDRFPSDGSTLEYYKARVDYAREHNQWLIFMLHSWHTSHTSTQQEYISQTIDYIKSLGIPIMTVNDAMRIVGNTIDTGDYHYYGNGDYFVTGADGTSRSSDMNYQIKRANEFSLDTPLSGFPFGTSVTPITTTAVNNSARKPVDIAGTLITHKSVVSNDFSYQEYHGLNGRVYKAIASGSGAWGPWVNPLRYHTIDTNINVTVPAKSTINHVVSGTGVNRLDVVSVSPSGNIEAGISFSSFVTNGGEVVIRLANVTDTAITLSLKNWRINSISKL